MILADLIDPNVNRSGPHIALEQVWARSVEEFLPVSSENPFWRYSRRARKDDPQQGWKIHVSATVLTANVVLRAIGPTLISCHTLFKAPSTLYRLMKLNSGIFFDYSQVGKFLTIYPKSEVDFVDLVETLEPILAPWSAGPAVAFDIRYAETCIYYRYGAFGNGTKITALDGGALEDSRDQRTLVYSTARDPFAARNGTRIQRTDNPFSNKYMIYEALSQRGKGGVYGCVDLCTPSARECIVKEGRLNGETSWTGQDGLRRIRNERRVLSFLAKMKNSPPAVYEYFEYEGNGYLALEKIEGIRLDRLMSEELSPPVRLDLAQQSCDTIASIHEAGWIWRDCKPQNFIVESTGILRPIDFEGACRIDEPDWERWSTPSFTNPDGCTSSVSSDLYQLATCLFLLLFGQAVPSYQSTSDFIWPKLREALLAVREGRWAASPTARLIETLVRAEQNQLETSG